MKVALGFLVLLITSFSNAHADSAKALSPKGDPSDILAALDTPAGVCAIAELLLKRPEAQSSSETQFIVAQCQGGWFCDAAAGLCLMSGGKIGCKTCCDCGKGYGYCC